MSLMYCEHCDRLVDTDLMDHCEWEKDGDPDYFKCESCVDGDYEIEIEKNWWRHQDDEMEAQDDRQYTES